MKEREKEKEEEEKNPRWDALVLVLKWRRWLFLLPIIHNTHIYNMPFPLISNHFSRPFSSKGTHHCFFFIPFFWASFLFLALYHSISMKHGYIYRYKQRSWWKRRKIYQKKKRKKKGKNKTIHCDTHISS